MSEWCHKNSDTFCIQTQRVNEYKIPVEELLTTCELPEA